MAYAKKIHQIITALDVQTATCLKAPCVAMLTFPSRNAATILTRTETKNVNSFRFLEAAINYEIQRQIDVLQAGDRVIQETRLYDPDKDETRPMRSKEWRWTIAAF